MRGAGGRGQGAEGRGKGVGGREQRAGGVGSDPTQDKFSLWTYIVS